MEYAGLCSTCVNVKTCIFDKKAVVWQCEEFDILGNKTAARSRGNTKKLSVAPVATEAE